MQTTKKRVTVSSKGQLVIPKDVRKSLNITEGEELLLEVVKGGVLLRSSSRPRKPGHRLRGLLKGKNLDPEECEAILEEAKKMLLTTKMEHTS
ncbi:MAG: AbrB/MazE/SpoVT family DNA-binding domain-containing protein [Nitrososphaerota archaeon]|nr:AbrB/MazE/SpoVT family DNA-binding domain-containing protein [Nitrososphaerota archaeon]